MDEPNQSISPHVLYARLGSERAPIIVDVRRDADFVSADALVVDAFHRSPDAVEQWRTELLDGRKVVTYRIHGREVSQGWLIRRFIDPNADFIYVPKEQVLAIAQRTGGNPYDIDGVEFTHEGERCSFDTILRIYDIKDPALGHLATIVRGADTSRHDLSPSAAAGRSQNAEARHGHHPSSCRGGKILMTHKMKRPARDPVRVKAISERLIISHYNGHPTTVTRWQACTPILAPDMYEHSYHIDTEPQPPITSALHGSDQLGRRLGAPITVFGHERANAPNSCVDNLDACDVLRLDRPRAGNGQIA